MSVKDRKKKDNGRERKRQELEQPETKSKTHTDRQTEENEKEYKNVFLEIKELCERSEQDKGCLRKEEDSVAKGICIYLSPVFRWE